MTATNSLETNGALKPGEPALLIRLLQAKGDLQPPLFQQIDKQNLLTLSTKAVSPDFKLLLYPFKGGEPLPETKWNAIQSDLEINLPDQKDSISFSRRHIRQDGFHDQTEWGRDCRGERTRLQAQRSRFGSSDG